MKEIIEAVMSGEGDPTDRIFERLHDMGWRSPDEVNELRRGLWSSGRIRGVTTPTPKNSVINGCPHCGGIATLAKDPTSEDIALFYVECSTCMIRTVSYDDPCRPIFIWNRRVKDEDS